MDTPEGAVIGGYSITSSPFQRATISIAVKKVPNARAAVHLHERARVGDVYTLAGPNGEFYYEVGMGNSVAFIAGGIGVTPFVSMVRYINDGRLDVQATLLYSARTPSELVFFDELTGISRSNPNIRCRFTVTQPHSEPWAGRVGRIDVEMLKECVALEDTLFFICGPNDMPEQMTHLLKGLGIPASRIRTEAW